MFRLYTLVVIMILYVVDRFYIVVDIIYTLSTPVVYMLRVLFTSGVYRVYVLVSVSINNEFFLFTCDVYIMYTFDVNNNK